MTAAPQEWTAWQCASYRGITRQEWLEAVRSGQEPPPVREQTDSPRWSRAEVLNWRRPGEWTATECAKHHGLKLEEWRSLATRGKVPAPVRRVHRTPVWDETAVRAARGIPRRDADAEWTAAECAAFHGVSLAQWRAAVRQGKAPAPVRTEKATRFWDSEQVKQVVL